MALGKEPELEGEAKIWGKRSKGWRKPKVGAAVGEFGDKG